MGNKKRLDLTAWLGKALAEKNEPTKPQTSQVELLPAPVLANSDEVPVTPEIRKGYLLIGLFFGALLVWGLTSPLSSAAIAPGEVIIEGHRKQIQHVEGGVVRDILIHDGDQVTAGQVLFKLDDIKALTEYETTRSQLIISLARLARLQAEFDNKSTITFSEWLMDQIYKPDVLDAINSQKKIFNARQELVQDEREIIQIKASQQQKLLKGSERRLRALEQRLRLVQKERRSYQRLVDQQLATRGKLYDLESREQALLADIADTESTIAQTRDRLDQLNLEKTQLNAGNRRSASEKLDILQSKVLGLQQSLNSARNRLEQTEIRSPIDGVIVDQQIHTPGGVIKAGQAIAQVVPQTGQRIVAAKINPKDRDTVVVGQAAEVRFSAFNQRSSRPIKGRVSLISADSLVNAADQSSYYRAHIELLEQPEDVIVSGSIHPGMQAEVIIVTGKRTAFEYLTSPIARSFNRALREE